jgi:hypothetical protein
VGIESLDRLNDDCVYRFLVAPTSELMSHDILPDDIACGEDTALAATYMPEATSCELSCTAQRPWTSPTDIRRIGTVHRDWSRTGFSGLGLRWLAL